MLARTLRAAILAGFLAGLVASAIHFATVVPLILEAEGYEVSAPAAGGHDHASHSHGEEGAAPAAAPPETSSAGGILDALGGPERTVYTLVANVLLGMGFAFLISAAIVFTGRSVTPRQGAIWGLAGFFVVALAPALGLPPELPGMPAADLYPRQVWWWGTVALTAVGAGLILLQNRAVWILVGVGLILLPHIIGAPQPDSHESDVPAALATSFTVASLGASAVFWLVLGTAVGWLLGREAETSGAAEARPG